MTLKVGHHEMAFRLRADIGPPLNAGLMLFLGDSDQYC